MISTVNLNYNAMFSYRATRAESSVCVTRMIHNPQKWIGSRNMSDL